MTPVHPLVTVVTVVRNAAADIAPTLASVGALKTPEVEYVVIDGGSTDGTLEVIEAHRAFIDVLVCEPDRGIYDAMNKAMARARGRFIVHVNAGDTLLRLPLDELRNADASAAVLAFPVRLSSGGVHRPRAGLLLRITNTVHHQGAFYRRERLLPYDLRYGTFSDFDLNQRLRRGVRACPEASPVALHTAGGQSSNRKHFHEVYQIVMRHHGRLHVAATWAYFKIQGLRRRIRSSARSSS